MSDIRVRAATPGDLNAVLELLAALGDLQDDWRVFPPRAELRDEVAAIYRRSVKSRDEEDLVVVALADGEVVGTAFGHVITPSSFSDEPALELSGVMVRPSHRGLGAGRALTREIARFARRRGIRMVTLKTFAQNEPALRFWEAMGFRPRMVQMVAPADRLAGETGGRTHT
jgi:GNAT superfamily N-acetyltransferase